MLINVLLDLTMIKNFLVKKYHIFNVIRALMYFAYYTRFDRVFVITSEETEFHVRDFIITFLYILIYFWLLKLRDFILSYIILFSFFLNHYFTTIYIYIYIYIYMYVYSKIIWNIQ